MRSKKSRRAAIGTTALPTPPAPMTRIRIADSVRCDGCSVHVGCASRVARRRASAARRTASRSGRCSSGRASCTRRPSGPTSRPRTYGPRSTTGDRERRGRCGLRNVISVPHGSVRWATPTSVLASASGRRPCRCRRGPGRTTRRCRSCRHGFLTDRAARRPRAGRRRTGAWGGSVRWAGSNSVEP